MEADASHPQHAVAAFARGLVTRTPSAVGAIDLVAHGEHAIALENLISNLHDEEVSLSPAEVVEGVRLVGALGLHPLHVDLLRALPGPDHAGLRRVVFTVAHAGLYGRAARSARAAAPVPVKVWCWEVLARRTPGPAPSCVACPATTAAGKTSLAGESGQRGNRARERAGT
jgi:hypothetical protein